MAERTDATADESDLKEITAFVDVDTVVKALKLNNTHGVDDRVIKVPQRDGTEASIRRAFRGSERYTNPKQAPVHISPESLVEDEFTRMPERHQIDHSAIGVPLVVEERDEDDEAAIDEAFDVLVDVWEQDVRGMIEDAHEFTVESKGVKIELIGVTEADQ